MVNGKILATVNGRAITEEDVNSFMLSMGAQGRRYDSPEGRAALLEELIARALFLADAKKNLLEYEEGFKAQLAEVKDRLLTGYAMEKALARVNVPEEEVRKYYDEHKEEMTAGETVSASHILVGEEETAKDLLEKIRAGEMSFEDAAKNFSTCPSGQKGGSLGEFGRGQMVPEFDEACFGMEVGELRGPVKTQFGYHLIRLDGKKKAKPLSYAEVKEQIAARLMQEKQQAAYRSRVNQLKILYPVEKF